MERVTAFTWTREHARHALALLRQGRNPAATVYDSLGPSFFLALDEGWLNLGLWEGDGTDPAEAPVAVRRLVRHLADPLPKSGTILDVGNGLAAQDPLIAEVARPERLLALNITESQLRAGRERLREAGAAPIAGDATRIPLADGTVDGVISVEAAFHFPSRERFFAEAFRVLRPGGVLSMSDVPTQRIPRGPLELVSGLAMLRLWGLHVGSAVSAGRIVGMVEDAGFEDVRADLVGERVIAPAIAFVRRRLGEAREEVPLAARAAVRVALGQIELLWRSGVNDYLLLRAVRP